MDPVDNSGFTTIVPILSVYIGSVQKCQKKKSDYVLKSQTSHWLKIIRKPIESIIPNTSMVLNNL